MDLVIDAEINNVPEGYLSIPYQGNFYHHILACLGYPNDAPPVADLLRRYHGLAGQWLIASPIYWQATHNDAMIIASGYDLQCSEEESKTWFAAFKESMGHDNTPVYYHDAHTWLVQCDDKPPISARPVHMLHHQSMMPELAKLDNTLFWQRLITEYQMFFSAQPYPINGVWFWGGGQLSDRVQRPIICLDSDLVDLAKLLSSEVNKLNFESLDPMPNQQDALMLLSHLDESQRCALQTQLRKKASRWYWNNLAYTSGKPKGWLSRLKFSK